MGKKRWKYWQEDCPASRTSEEVLAEQLVELVQREEADRKLSKTHFVDLMAFDGHCDINGKVLTNDEVRQYAKTHFTVGQKLTVNENGQFKYNGTLTDIVEKSYGIVGTIVED